MKVSALFHRLAAGELSNLALVNQETLTIESTQRPKIIVYLNDGLMRLHTRFLLKENDLIIEQMGFITNYLLTAKYAQSNRDPSQTYDHSFYIMDLHSKFLDDVIKILTVTDIGGMQRALNNVENVYSLYTPKPNVLQIPYPVTGSPLSVTYQASHPPILNDAPDQEIDLPDFLEGALSSYIAHKVFSHMNTQESTLKAAEHLKAFDTICLEAQDQALISTESSTSGNRFEQRGWA
jgi:hypothetical protein